jgi:hypothetical protein
MLTRRRHLFGDLMKVIGVMDDDYYYFNFCYFFLRTAFFLLILDPCKIDQVGQGAL